MASSLTAFTETNFQQEVVNSKTPVLVDFGATWCGPCRQSIPHLNALQAKFKDRLVVIGLSAGMRLATR